MHHYSASAHALLIYRATTTLVGGICMEKSEQLKNWGESPYVRQVKRVLSEISCGKWLPTRRGGAWKNFPERIYMDTVFGRKAGVVALQFTKSWIILLSAKTCINIDA